jgi:hypothetical protein
LKNRTDNPLKVKTNMKMRKNRNLSTSSDVLGSYCCFLQFFH